MEQNVGTGGVDYNPRATNPWQGTAYGLEGKQIWAGLLPSFRDAITFLLELPLTGRRAVAQGNDHDARRT